METSFCGDSPFWNHTAIEKNWWPEFTSCFQETVMTYVPCGWLWLTFIPHLIYLKKHRQDVVLGTSWLLVCKFIICALLSLLPLFQIVSALTDNDPPLSYVVSKTVWAGTFVLCCALIYVSQRKGLCSPCIIFIFWTLTLITAVVPVYSGIILLDYDKRQMTFSISCIMLYLIVIEYIFHCCNEKRVAFLQPQSFKTPCGLLTASFPSKLFFSWSFKQIYLGFKRTVVINDAMNLPPDLYCRNNVPGFWNLWKHEISQLQTKNESRNAHSMSNGRMESVSINTSLESNERTPLLSHNNGEVRGQRGLQPAGQAKTETPSLVKIILKLHWPQIMKYQLIGIFADVLFFANAVLLSSIIDFVEHRENYPEYQGFVFAVSFSLVTVTCTLLQNQKLFHMWLLGQQVRMSLMAAVYKKTLTMNADSRRQFTSGTIVNLMAVDCLKFVDISMSIWALFSSPVIFSICFYMLYNTLGLSFIAGIVVLVGIIPIVTAITSKIKKLQQEILKVKDHRIKLMTEILNGIRVLKLYAWEPSFQDQINQIRNLELKKIFKNAILACCTTLFWFLSPMLVTVLTFFTFTFASSTALTPSIAFVSISLFNNLRAPINVLPDLLSKLAQIMVSIERLENFLSGKDLVEMDTRGGDKDHPLVMENATFLWDHTQEPVLKGLNIQIPKGKLVAVVGPVGSGKSSLLSAFLGEMEKVRGHVSARGSIAYVPQQAWIQNLTLRDNILFSEPMLRKRYKDVISACALEPDLELLPGGELTEIGEKGINLSGGQKQRVNLARAVYSDSDVYLLDDPLSAVDTHVGKHIFDQVIGPQGLLKHKTRILVTHGIHWLPQVDYIYVMEQGRITERGTYQHLMDHNGPFALFVQTYLIEHGQEELEDEEIMKMTAIIYEQAEALAKDESEDEPKKGLRRTRSHHSQSSQNSGSNSSHTHVPVTKETAHGTRQNNQDGQDRLIEEERSEIGKLRAGVIRAVVKAFGTPYAILVPVVILFYQGMNILSGIWLSKWTDDPYLRNESNSGTEEYRSETYKYLGFYAAINVLNVAGNGVFIVIVFLRMVSASRILHYNMLNTIFHQGMAFFDTTPVGRILNRFSKDINIVDATIPYLVRITLHNLFQLVAIIIIISYSTPIFIAVAVPVFVLYFFLQKFYIPSSRQYQRLVSTTSSPIYSHFAESINGASTIRAYKSNERFFQSSQNLIDINNTCTFNVTSTARWLRMRLEVLGSLIVLASALFAILYGDVSGGTVGLSITYSLLTTQALNNVMLNSTLLETNSVSVERIVDYTSLSHEPSWTVPEHRPNPSWPETGEIEFHNYSTRYRAHLDLVLKSLTFKIAPGEKVGIVGRTGAGKSSLSMGLFRVLEAAEGSILVDGVDISTIGLHDVRSKLTILPQDPVLFSGTLRVNLDPFDNFSDAEIWQALDNAHLKSFVSGLPNGLSFLCEEGGQNLSVGQRQLMCLARSLLRKTQILVLDEATAAVDLETDSIIQKTIREAFKDCTVLTVAHRLNTVIDYDKIMVLDRGQIVEFDKPEVLLADKQGVFYSMAKDAGVADQGIGKS